jgi:hypothetical protein
MERVQFRGRAERRKEQRFTADIERMIAWDGTSEPVTIRNISAYGALLHGRCFPPIGTRLTLISESLEVCRTVIWLGVDRCGLLLSSAVEPTQVLQERPVRTTDLSLPPLITLQRIRPGAYG